MEQIGHADAAFRKAGTYDIRRARCFLRFHGIVISTCVKVRKERTKIPQKIVSPARYSMGISMAGLSLRKKADQGSIDFIVNRFEL